MRTWLLSLLLVGLGTAGGFKWWRNHRAAVGAPDGTVADAKSGADEAAPVVLPEDQNAPIALNPEKDAKNAESVESASVPSAQDAEAAPVAVSDDGGAREVPGGAVNETEVEARRKASQLLETAAKSTSPIEQAKLLTQALRSGLLDKTADEKAYADLLEANKRGLLNPRFEEGFVKAEVKKGDSLWSIGKRVEKENHLHVTPGLIRLVNGMASNSIYPGASLKVPSQPIGLFVKKSKFRLEVLIGDVMIRRYLVGLGKDNKTPEGKFTIATRLKDPPWFKPGVGALPPDHPENILGTRWLGFAAKEGFPDAATFGVHGTKEDHSIGTESSNGCVRMHNAEVEELFEWIPEGATVEIVP